MASDEIAANEDLTTDLEKRLRRLSSTAFGGGAIKKITDEVENRPLVVLGIGFPAGLVNRR